MITDKWGYLKPFRVLFILWVIWFSLTAIVPGCERAFLMDRSEAEKAEYMEWLGGYQEYQKKQARER